MLKKKYSEISKAINVITEILKEEKKLQENVIINISFNRIGKRLGSKIIRRSRLKSKRLNDALPDLINILNQIRII